MEVKCGAVSIKLRHDRQHQQNQDAYISLPGGIGLKYMSVWNMVCETEPIEDDYPEDVQVEIRALNLERVTKASDDILKVGRWSYSLTKNGEYSNVLSVRDFLATVSVSRKEDNWKTTTVNFGEHDTVCLLHAVCKFAQLWAGGASSDAELRTYTVDLPGGGETPQ